MNFADKTGAYDTDFKGFGHSILLVYCLNARGRLYVTIYK